MEDIYPMPAFVTLQVKDVEASSQWYQEALGFRSIYQAPAPLSLVHLRRDRYQDILLVPVQPSVEVTPSATIVMNFGLGQTKLAALTEKVQAAGGRYAGPIEQPWNALELTVYDPDGYVIKFSEPTNLNRSFEDIMDNAVRAAGSK